MMKMGDHGNNRAVRPFSAELESGTLSEDEAERKLAALLQR